MCKSSPSRKCLHCGTEFEPSHYNAKLCSPECKKARAELKMSEYRACPENKVRARQLSSDHYAAKRDDPEFKAAATARAKEHHYKSQYGISIYERDAMFASQDGCCGICGTHMTLDPRKPNTACVDHCHSTGEVHSLLCNGCNMGIGHLGENPVILAKAIQYLTETGKVPTR